MARAKKAPEAAAPAADDAGKSEEPGIFQIFRKYHIRNMLKMKEYCGGHCKSSTFVLHIINTQ
jgi:L-lysine 2,3-aminomutase